MCFDEAEMGDPSWAMCFAKLALLYGYWEMLLSPEVQEVSTFVSSSTLYIPTFVPQGGSNGTSHVQGILARIFRALKRKIWVDNVFFMRTVRENCSKPWIKRPPVWKTLDYL